jgi:Co/Zn/Cd efflux system component
VLRRPSADDAAIRLAYVHNRGDALMSLAPVAGGLAMLVTGASVVDPAVAALIAVAIVAPTLLAFAASGSELVWPERVRCGHGPGRESPAVHSA